MGNRQDMCTVSVSVTDVTCAIGEAPGVDTGRNRGTVTTASGRHVESDVMKYAGRRGRLSVCQLKCHLPSIHRRNLS